jgi:TolA-binding protein
MNKLAVLFVCACMVISSQVLYAEEKKDNTPNFWEKLRAKIEQMAPQKKVTATTAVGGVRGAKMAVDDVYWKGEKAAQTVDADELEAFTSAVSLAAAGEHAKAQAAFAEFVSKNPDSPLRKDADLALAQLKTSK